MFLENKYRTNTCEMLSENDIGKTVRVAGWVENIRDHGGIKFIDLRDHYGYVQITFQKNEGLLEGVNKECAVTIGGTVIKRAEGTYNDKIATGTIEIVAESLEVLGKVLDALGENRNLNLGGTRVLLVLAVFLDELGYALFGNAQLFSHASTFPAGV